MSKFVQIFIVLILLLVLPFLGNFSPIYAQNSCSISFSQSTLSPGEEITINISNATFNGALINVGNQEGSSDGGDFSINLNPDTGYTSPNIAFNNGSGSITLSYDDFLGIYGNYSFNLRHYTGLLWNFDNVCSSSQSLVILPSNEVCSAFSVTPSEATPGIMLTVNASGCDPGSYLIESYPGAYNASVTVSNQGTLLNYRLGPISEPGTYTFIFAKENSPNEAANIAVVTISEGVIEYQCGSTVNFDTPICDGTTSSGCCPVQCPTTIRNVAGNGTEMNQISQCACGMVGETCCPGNLCSGQGLETLVCNTDLSTPKCEVADPNQINIYQCGQVVSSIDRELNTYSCVANCPAAQKADGSIWCACGGQGNSCCTASPTVNVCSDSNLICLRGYCMPDPDRYNLPPYLCSISESGINTAIGCIDFSSPQKVAIALLRFVIPFVGGIALVFIAFSAIIYMTSSGDPKKIAMAKEILVSALAGTFVIVLSAWLLSVIGVDVLGLFS